jgi:hypothetical protein
MKHTTPDRKSSLCSECPFHLTRIQALLQQCDKDDSAHCLEKVGQEFSALNTAATAYDRIIIMKYAQGMAAFARYLDEQQGGPAPADRRLLIEGVELGMRCKDDTESLCMEMHFDQICALLDKINARMQDSRKPAAA